MFGNTGISVFEKKQYRNTGIDTSILLNDVRVAFHALLQHSGTQAVGSKGH